jgi:transposase
LYEEIRAAGYTGGYTQVKDCVRQMRPMPPAEPVVRFRDGRRGGRPRSTSPSSGCRGQALRAGVVLGYSRLLWLQFYTRQTMLVLMRGLEDALPTSAASRPNLLFDQLKAVIIDDEREVGGRLLENAEFMRFAAHWDFRVRACRPYRAQTKGKVERPIGYVRQGFFYRRSFSTMPTSTCSAVGARADRQPAPPSHHWRSAAPALRARRARSLAVLGVAPVSIVDRDGQHARAVAAVANAGRVARRAASARVVRPTERECAMSVAQRHPRDAIRDLLADLKMPGSLEAVDAILHRDRRWTPRCDRSDQPACSLRRCDRFATERLGIAQRAVRTSVTLKASYARGATHVLWTRYFVMESDASKTGGRFQLGLGQIRPWQP